jgi:1-acyl-sn-glycerol-3-phosphate acyltransferase
MLKKLALKIYLFWAVANFCIIMTLSLPLIVLPIIILGERHGSKTSYFFLKLWGLTFGFLSFIRFKTVRNVHISPENTFVYVANHASYLDSPAFVIAIPGNFRPLGKIEMKKIPVFGLLYPYVVVTIDRSSISSKRKSMAQLKEKLNSGFSIFLFPEGKMNQTEETLLPFQDGAFRVAIETQKPIVPMLILNARRLLPRSKFELRPGTITTVFLDPVPTEGLQLEDLPKLKQTVFEQMKEGLEEHELSINKKSTKV